MHQLGFIHANEHHNMLEQFWGSLYSPLCIIGSGEWSGRFLDTAAETHAKTIRKTFRLEIPPIPKHLTASGGTFPAYRLKMFLFKYFPPCGWSQTDEQQWLYCGVRPAAAGVDAPLRSTERTCSMKHKFTYINRNVKNASFLGRDSFFFFSSSFPSTSWEQESDCWP